MANKHKKHGAQGPLAEKQGVSKKTVTEQKNWSLLATLVSICLIALWPVLKNNFINWDDNAHVFDNPQLKEDFSKAISYFFGPHTVIGNYIPLTMTAYLLLYKLMGLDASMFHGLNLVLHLINVTLVFRFIYQLSGQKKWVAFFVALFFGIHPMHVESVAWVSELKDVLYTLFFLLALLRYLTYLKQPEKVFPFASLWFGLLAVFAKPAAIVLPLILLLLDYYQKRRFSAKLIIEKIPFFIVSFVFGYIALRSQHADDLLHNQYALGERLLFGSYALLNYLIKFVFPYQLSIFYPYPNETNGQQNLLLQLSPLVCLGLAVLVYIFRKHHRALVFGSLFFLINLLLVLQLVSFGDAFMAERYTYVAYIGLLYALAMTVNTYYEKHQGRPGTQFIVAGVSLFALIYGILSYQRCQVWKDDYVMAQDLVSKQPNDWLSLNNMGYILFEQKRYEEAIPYFEKAIRLKPSYVRAANNLCNTFLQVNAPEKALMVIDSALTKNPKNFYLLVNKANIHLRYYQQYQQAATYFEKAANIETANVNVFIDLAECYYGSKDYNKALTVLNRAITRFPDDHVLYNNRGYIYFLQGNYAEAEKNYNRSLSIMPDYQMVKANLEALGKAKEAKKD